MRVTRTILGIAVATLLYMAAATFVALRAGNQEFIFYIVVMLLMIGAVVAVHWRFVFPASVLAGLSVWGAMHMAGGLTPIPESWPIGGETHVLYNWNIVEIPVWGWIKYDQVVHAFGYGVTTWLLWSCVVTALREREVVLRPTFGWLTLIVAASCGFGALNEIVEFIATRLTVTNVGGYENTARDLIANNVGALAAAVLIRVLPRRS